MGCMNERKGQIRCLHCGYEEGENATSPLYLPPRSELSGRYIVGKVLGHGGFGITYLAFDKLKHEKVAIKEYFPNQVVSRSEGQPEVVVINKELFFSGREKFLDEAVALERFRHHPGIVTVYNFFHDHKTAYMVMEYLEGDPLSTYLAKRNGKVSSDHALELLSNIFIALSEMHKSSFLHRDIKPSNIFVRKNSYEAILIDFGATRQFVGQETMSFSAIVTPGFAPFEQYYKDGEQNSWTDVYALGATLYFMLSGEIPPESISRLSQDRYIPLVQKNISVPTHVDTAINKALAVESSERFATVESFLLALQGQSLIKKDIDIGETEIAAPQAMQTKAICPSCKTANFVINAQAIKSTICYHCGTPLDRSDTPGKPGKSMRKRGLIALAALGLILAGSGYLMLGGKADVANHEKIEQTAMIVSEPVEQPSSTMDQQTAMTQVQVQASQSPPVPVTSQPVQPNTPIDTSPKPQSPQQTAEQVTKQWETDVRGIRLAGSGVKAGESLSYSGGTAAGYADGSGTLSYFRGGVLQRQLRATWIKGFLVEGTTATMIYPDRQVPGRIVNGAFQ